MQQTELWHDTIFDALGACVQSAGGVKTVAARLWPAMDSTSAAARLRAALNPEHAQKLDLEELILLAKLARDAGDGALMNFLGRELGYEVKALSQADAKKHARRARKLALLEELRRLEDD
jgi:hypothetical protein